MKVTINGTFYAKVTNEANGEERVATMSITNVDGNPPMIERLETSNQKPTEITLTVTAKDNETGIPDTNAYKWYIDDEPTPKATTDVNYYTFTDLTRGQRVTHTFKVEVIDNVGNTQERSTEAIPFPAKANEIIKPENYGDKIEYSANGVDDWKIFYADEDYVYIITSEYLDNVKLPNSSGLSKGNKNKNVFFSSWETPSSISTISGYQDSIIINRFVTMWSKDQSTGSANFSKQFLDFGIWKSFVNDEYAEECVGTVPVEMLSRSWNEKHPEESINLKVNNDGYYAGSAPKEAFLLTIADTLYRLGNTGNDPTYLILAGPLAYCRTRA